MRQDLYALVLPLIVIPIVGVIIVAIGSTLLAVGEFWAVPTALAFAFLVIFGAMYMEWRGQQQRRAP